MLGNCPIYSILLIPFLLASLSCSFPDRSGTLPELTQQEEIWLKNHQVIKVGPDPLFPPIEYFDETGQYRGIGSDYIKLMEEILPIRFKIDRSENWQQVMSKAESRKIDMFGAAAPTEDRLKYMNFTDPYITLQAVIVIPKDEQKDLTLEDLEEKNIGVASGFITHNYLKTNYPWYSLIPVETIEEGLARLSFGEIDAFVGFIPSILHIIEKEGYSNIKLAGTTKIEASFGFAVRKDWPELQSILNKALMTVSPHIRKEIWQKWVQIGTDRLLENRTFRLLLIGLFSAGLLTAGIVLIWITSLRKAVSLKTRALQNELKQRELMEENLIQSENRYRSLVNNLPGAVCRSIDGEGRTIIYISDYIFQITGYPSSDYTDTSKELFRASIHPDDWEQTRRVIRRSMKERSIYQFSYRIRHADGSIRWVREKGQPIYSKKGEFCFLDGFIYDMTSLVKAEEQLRQTQKMETVGILAGGIAHDFNNILGGITATVSLMDYLIDTDKKIETGKFREYLEILKDSSDRASGIVQKLLTLSRKKEITLTPVDLNQIVASVMKICSHSLDKSVRLNPEYTKERALVQADPGQLEQVLLNFCVNAEHAMTIMRPDDQTWGGVLSIAIKLAGNEDLYLKEYRGDISHPYWCISISDTGIGIRKDKILEIFNPFYTTKEKGKGLGLGLSMAFNIIQSHSGYIDVKSVEHKGSEFCIYLPVLKEAPQEEPEKTEKTGVKTGKGKILIVDDEQVLREMTRTILESFGYEILMAENGRKALEVIAGNPSAIDMVLLDMIMPGLTCKETIKGIQNRAPALKILLTSGFSEDKRIRELMDMGVEEFIRKPFTLQKLTEAVKRIMERKQLSDP